MKITTDRQSVSCPSVRLGYESAWLFIYTKRSRMPEAEVNATGDRRVFEADVYYLRVGVDSDTVTISGAPG